MNIAFTICSNNYLAQAKALGDSFKKHHPEIEFIIGLVDIPNSKINYDAYRNFIILRVDEICIPALNELSAKYDIIELNTVVKPFFFKHLFQQKQATKIIYLDPDIQVFSRFTEVLDLLDDHNIVITPQNLIPIDDGNSPGDRDLLGTGVFNLGFIALSDYSKVENFIEWWLSRVSKYGFNNVHHNMFYDQLWINLVPAFFNNYFILKHPGYNMSPSNLHERIFTGMQNEIPVINKEHLLRFYHYTGYKILQPEIICSYSGRFTFETRRDITALYYNYTNELLANNIESLHQITPAYCLNKLQDTSVQKFSKRIKSALRILVYGE